MSVIQSNITEVAAFTVLSVASIDTKQQQQQQQQQGVFVKFPLDPISQLPTTPIINSQGTLNTAHNYKLQTHW